jgi:flagellar biosynthetic protein FliR
MPSLETFLVTRFMVFTLVLTRTSTLLMTAPIFGTAGLPRHVRALVAVAISLLVTPVYLGTTLPPVEQIVDYGHLLVNEALTGLLLGLSVNILFSGIQVAGQVVSQMSGLSLAAAFDPAFEEDVSVFSQLFYFLTMALFVAIGGHRIVMEALLDTFAIAPPGHAGLGHTFLEVLTNVATQSCALGIRAAAPLLTALLISNIVLGLISRTLPQINVIAVGFGVNGLLTLGVLVLSLGAVAWTFQDPATEVLKVVTNTIAAGG